MTRVWSWGQSAEIARLRTEERAARLSCSAEAKRANRLRTRILMLDAALARKRRQIKHDQVYIDKLEAAVKPKKLAAIRMQMRGIGRPR